MSRLKDNLITGIAVLMLLTGMGMLIYPTAADWWNTVHQTQIIGDYDQAVVALDPYEHDQIFLDAARFNAQLAQYDHHLLLSDEERAAYYKLLDITGTGVMGYVGIPKMNVTIPIYHGTSDSVLSVGAGHLEGTSLPIGGIGTHASITAHRGLPSARLFTDLTTLRVGDRFYITTLDRTLTYEVDQVRVVLPNEIDDLRIDQEKDYFTLVTCTPYGVNSHRLLVRGERVDGAAGDLVVLADAVRIEPRFVAPILAIPILLGAIVWVVARSRYRTQHQQAADAAEEDLRRRRDLRQGKSISAESREGGEDQGD